MTSETPRRPALRLGGCLVALAVLLVGGFLALSWLLETPSPGVDLAPDLDAYAWEELEAAGRLGRDETVRAFYDLTRSMDGSEALVVTNRRLLLYRGEREQFVRWGPDTVLRRDPVGAAGSADRFEVSGSGGVIVFEVAAGHGADRLEQTMQATLAAVNREVESAAPAVQIPSLQVTEPDGAASEELPSPEVP